jgi:hypothetical protein
MGGRGSGGHNSKGKLRNVQCARLEVHELAREGKLKLGTRGWLFGTIWFEVIGGPDAQQLVLEFPRRQRRAPWTPCGRSLVAIGAKRILAGDTSCSCAANATAQRASSMLAMPITAWFLSCRKCAGITYQSTMGHRWDRSARHVEKLRARLQWGWGGTLPVKPRAMHERTYQRILGMLAYHEAVRKQGASYARKYRPDQHRAYLWRQCQNRFAVLGGWPLR